MRVFSLVMLVFAGAAWAEAPLAKLPGEPGPHVEKITSLGENQWLELGKPAADPKWGRARGRSWCSTMPFAAKLRGAFLYGEGVHGYAKPDGHYMDDLWFYDVNGHRWICCSPGADTKALALTINKDGFEANSAGELVPVAQQVHAYAMDTFDTDAGRFLSMPNTHEYWKKALPQRVDWLKPPPKDASPWSYDPASGKWDRRRTGTPAPPSGYGDTFINLPGQHRAFFAHRSQEIWFYDTVANKWSRPKVDGPPPPFGIDATSCYDPKRERIYIGGGSYPVAPDSGHAFWAFDLKANRWVDPQPKGKPCRGSNSYSTLNALMIYEPVADKVLLIRHSGHYDTGDRTGIFVYDPVTNAWAEEPLPLPQGLRNRQVKNGFFDPELNAIFIHSAGDSQDDGVMWVYRFKKRP
jgi:hypothetical protein